MTHKLSKRHFWKWFERNNNEYLQLDKMNRREAAYWVNELRSHLRAYFKFLDFTLSFNSDERLGTLTISVNGASDRFKRVDALVALAPSIVNWEIQALDEPMPLDFLLEERYGQTGIDPCEFYFLAEGGEEELGDIVIYHPLYTEERHGIFEEVAKAALYNLLGERSFGLDIGNVRVDNLSCAPKDAVLLKPEELPAILGCRKSGVFVDAWGRMVVGG